MEDNVKANEPTVDPTPAGETGYNPYKGLKEKVEDNFIAIQENFREYSWANDNGLISSFIIERPVKMAVLGGATLIVDAWGQGYIVGNWGYKVVKINVPVGMFPFTLEMLKQYWY